MSTRNIHFMIQKENVPKISINICFLGLSRNYLGTQKRVRNSRGKRVIGVRVI